MSTCLAHASQQEENISDSMEVSPDVLFPLLQEDWSRAREKALEWPAEKLTGNRCQTVVWR